MTAPHHGGRLSSPWMIRVAFVGLGLAIALVGVATFELWVQANRWDPLGPYPVQTLLSSSGATPIGIPTYYLDEEITVRGVKCVDSDTPVRVTVSMTWVSLEPPGSIIKLTPRGRPAVTLREPGCTQATYSNPIPPEVRDRILELMNEGVEQSTWRMSGVEIPERDDEIGVSRTWVTPAFVILHQNRPQGGGDA